MSLLVAYSVLLPVFLTGQAHGHQPPSYRPWPSPPDHEDFHRSFLEVSRQELAFREKMVAWEAKMIADHPAVFAPNGDSAFFQTHKVSKRELEKQRKWVQALERYEWVRALKPGIDAEKEAVARLEKVYRELWPERLPEAPMPREVKR